MHLPTTEEVAAQADRLAAINESIANLTQEANGIKAWLRDMVGEARNMPVGNHRLTITPTRRFDPDLAKDVLPPEWLALCVRPMVVSTLAKDVLPPDLYERCQSHGTLAVSVK